MSSNRMLSEKVSFRLYYAFIRSSYQSLLNVYPILSRTNKEKLEAINRKVFRIIYRWYDATNNEIKNLPIFKSMEVLTQTHFNKLLPSITRSNPSIIADYLQHKLYILFLNEYYTNPALQKQKREITGRGRTSNRIRKLLSSPNLSLSIFDHVFSFHYWAKLENVKWACV